jgi:hypothetical protein
MLHILPADLLRNLMSHFRATYVEWIAETQQGTEMVEEWR